MNPKLRLSLLISCLLYYGAFAQANDFPTQARVEYVLGCMNKHGGQNYGTLYQCICVVDKIAASFSYDEYTEAQTFTQLRSTPGERGGIFRDPPRAKELVQKLREAQQVAEASCFITRH